MIAICTTKLRNHVCICCEVTTLFVRNLALSPIPADFQYSLRLPECLRTLTPDETTLAIVLSVFNFRHVKNIPFLITESHPLYTLFYSYSCTIPRKQVLPMPIPWLNVQTFNVQRSSSRSSGGWTLLMTAVLQPISFVEAWISAANRRTYNLPATQLWTWRIVLSSTDETVSCRIVCVADDNNE